MSIKSNEIYLLKFNHLILVPQAPVSTDVSFLVHFPGFVKRRKIKDFDTEVKVFAKKEKKRKRPIQKVDSDLTGFFK